MSSIKKPLPFITSAAKMSEIANPLSSRHSVLSASPERSISRPHISAYTPPETPSLDSETTTLGSSAAGERTRIITRKPVPCTEVEDEDVQERHNCHHSDRDYWDEQDIPTASNDGGNVQQREDHIHDLQVPLLATNRLVVTKIQPDARWTKISKTLVDPRVLDDGDERYEEKTHDILVSRVLTKEEIDHYTSKTQEIKKAEADMFEAGFGSSISDEYLEHLFPIGKEAALASPNHKVELAGYLESSKQDDSTAVEENLSTENSKSATENGDSGFQSAADLLRVKQVQFHSLKTRNAHQDRGSSQDSNRIIIIFTIVTVILLPLSFVTATFGMNSYDRSVFRMLPAFTWSHKGLRYATISYACGACTLRMLGLILDLYRNYFSGQSHQRWHQISNRFAFTDTTIWTLIMLLCMINGTELIMMLSFDSSAGYTSWYASCCLVACVLVYLVIPETGSRTLEAQESTISVPTLVRQMFGLRAAGKEWIEAECIKGSDFTFFPAGDTELSKRKATRINWILREMRKILRSFVLNAKEQLSFLRQEHPTILSLIKKAPAVSLKKERIASQCRCGYRFYDDFTELRPSAAVKYEELLLRRSSTSKGRPHTVDQVAHEQSDGDTRTTSPPNSKRSTYISNGINGMMSIVRGVTDKEDSAPPLPQYQLGNRNAVVPGTSSRNQELLYLLMCIPQHQYATKLLQPQISAIRSDQDFFLLLRSNYRQMRGQIRRLLSLKALRSIKFVQLEMYKSELVDIRKQDDLPPEDKKNEYRYNPVPAEIIPPVGENHMLHLINHPTHAEEDGFVLDRIPKKLKEPLHVCPSRGTGLGWGIYFIEGWQVSIITIVAFAVLLAGSLAFLICWSVLKHDIQGASGVAAYIIAFLGLAIGSMQAVFELT